MELAADEEAKQGASSDQLEPAANNHPTDGEQSASASYELEQAAYATAASTTTTTHTHRQRPPPHTTQHHIRNPLTPQ